jgi:hypothetical protein
LNQLAKPIFFFLSGRRENTERSRGWTRRRREEEEGREREGMCEREIALGNCTHKRDESCRVGCQQSMKVAQYNTLGWATIVCTIEFFLF